MAIVTSAVLLWTWLSLIATGITSALLAFTPDSMQWYSTLKRAPFDLPNMLTWCLIPVVFALRATGCYFAFATLGTKSVGIYWGAFAMALVSLLLCIAWFFTFFVMRLIRLSLVIVLLYFATMLTLTILAYFLSSLAGGLLTFEPIWVLFVVVLNGYIVLFNEVEHEAKETRARAGLTTTPDAETDL